ncbi:MAG: polysaccharide biosynthesis tyrosine autokinase [Actinobacteria bacterium]|nr:polysaccharide biosynthesis tyrosine autokinase [Actinomycetota bacterium]
MELRAYLNILQQRRWLVISVFAAVVAVTAFVSWRLTPIYEAVAKVEVQPAATSSDDAARLLESLVDPTLGLQTQVELIQSQAVLGRVAVNVGLPSIERLEEQLAVRLVPDTQIVEVSIEHQQADTASEWANAIASAYVNFRRDRALDASLAAREQINRDIEEVQTRLSELEDEASASGASIRAGRDRALARLGALEAQLQSLPEEGDLLRGGGTVISAAQTPTEPVRPKKAVNLAISMVLGGLLGVGIALVADTLDDKIRTPEEVEEKVGAPILGYIPFVKAWDQQNRAGLAMFGTKASGAAEAYRTLRTNLSFVALERPLKTILVTGVLAGTGKSTCAANLAATLAQGGSKVILVSADLRRPSVHRLFELSNSKGLVTALDQKSDLCESLQDTEIRTLKLLAAGGLPPNPTEILASQRFGQLLVELRDLADYVVVDAPPVLGLGDSSALASQVDGVLFVVRPGAATKREVMHAGEQLRKAGGRVIGCLLNAVEANQGYGYYYHYYYSQYGVATNGQDSNGRGSGQDKPREPESALKS